MKPACWLCVLLAACAAQRIPETTDWEADAKTAASLTLRCPAKELSLQTIDRRFIEVGGRYLARGITARLSGCGKEGLYVWTPQAGWLGYEPDVKTGPVLDGGHPRP